MFYPWAAISIGFLGSLHCAGMCSPLLVAVHKGQQLSWSQFFHHAGRLTVYMILGGVAGAIGSTFSLLGLQQWFSLIAGVLLVLSVLLFPFTKVIKQWEGRIGQWSIKLSSWIHAKGRKGNQRSFMLGLANGILPCGLVYIAIAGAANTFTPWDGALFMLGFGLGTLPLLIAVPFLGMLLPIKLRNNARKLLPAGVLLIGLLLVVRGLNLGIPYLSPQHAESATEITSCH